MHHWSRSLTDSVIEAKASLVVTACDMGSKATQLPQCFDLSPELAVIPGPFTAMCLLLASNQAGAVVHRTGKCIIPIQGYLCPVTIGSLMNTMTHDGAPNVEAPARVKPTVPEAC